MSNLLPVMPLGMSIPDRLAGGWVPDMHWLSLLPEEATRVPSGDQATLVSAPGGGNLLQGPAVGDGLSQGVLGLRGVGVILQRRQRQQHGPVAIAVRQLGFGLPRQQDGRLFQAFWRSDSEPGAGREARPPGRGAINRPAANSQGHDLMSPPALALVLVAAPGSASPPWMYPASACAQSPPRSASQLSRPDQRRAASTAPSSRPLSPLAQVPARSCQARKPVGVHPLRNGPSADQRLVHHLGRLAPRGSRPVTTSRLSARCWTRRQFSSPSSSRVGDAAGVFGPSPGSHQLHQRTPRLLLLVSAQFGVYLVGVGRQRPSTQPIAS